MKECQTSSRRGRCVAARRRDGDRELALGATRRRFNTWLSGLTNEQAQARSADERLRAGEASLLCGIPWACKDIIGTKGVATTAGSKILEGYVPPYSATVVERLDKAGAVMMGKTNLDEFAMGSSNENSAFGPVKNPWRTDRVPGGSSGGSAVAVAAGEALFALGTDTGGSIRQPAALTGVVDETEIRARLTVCVVAFASSLDKAAPSRTASRTARSSASSSQGPNDATSSRCRARTFDAISPAASKGCVSACRRSSSSRAWEGCGPRGARRARRARRQRRRVVDVSLSLTDTDWPSLPLQPAEASATWPATTECATGCASRGQTLDVPAPRGKGFGRSEAAMILADDALSPATTTPTT